MCSYRCESSINVILFYIVLCCAAFLTILEWSLCFQLHIHEDEVITSKHVVQVQDMLSHLGTVRRYISYLCYINFKQFRGYLKIHHEF